MTFLINIANKIIVFLDLKLMKALGIINLDYGLIRYLFKIISAYIVSVDINGYLHIENRDKGETLIHRIVLEYYSKFDEKLRKALQNTDLEVNHKNKLTWDNRLENLEILTKENNLKHKYNKNYEVYISTEYLINIQNKLKNKKEYEKDKRYIQNVNRINNKVLLKESNNLQALYDNLYLSFNSITKCFNKNILKHINSNTLNYINNTLFPYTKNNLFNKYINFNSEYIFQNYNYKNIIERTFIEELIYYFHKYILFNLVHKNLKLLIQNKNKNLTKLLIKWNLLNLNYKSNPNKTFDLPIIHNILLDLYKMLLHGNIHFIIYKNQIIVNVPIKHLFCTRKVTNSFTILYYLEFLTKLPTLNKPNKNYIDSLNKDDRAKYYYFYNTHKLHESSHFILNKFTPELIKLANEKAEILLDADINKTSHYIMQENIGQEIADTLYKNPVCKSNTKRAEITANDINDILRNVFVEIESFGFYTVDEIIEHLKIINIRRLEKGEDFNEIYANCDRFVRSTLSNIPKTKQLLKDLNLKYVSLNKATIENIIKFQEKNNATLESVYDLHYNQKVIILKKLYKGGQAHGKCLHHKRSSKKTTQNRKNNKKLHR